MRRKYYFLFHISQIQEGVFHSWFVNKNIKPRDGEMPLHNSLVDTLGVLEVAIKIR